MQQHERCSRAICELAQVPYDENVLVVARLEIALCKIKQRMGAIDPPQHPTVDEERMQP